MKGKSFLLVFLVILPIFGWAVTNIRGQVATKVYVDPKLVTASPGGTFTVDVKIANVKSLWVYEMRFSWDPALLDVTEVTEGSFLNEEDTYNTLFVKKEDFPSVGHLYFACSRIWMGEPVPATANGNGTLAIIEFQVLDEGNCTLDLYDTHLANPDEHEIEHTAEDGFFKYPLSEVGFDPTSIIDPSLIQGDTFNVSITISMAKEVYAWRFKMNWNPTVLNVTRPYEGPFLKQEGNTSFATKISQEEGYLYANCTLSGEPPEASVSGNGTLMIVTFMVRTIGDTVLHISEAILLDYEGVEIHTITKDGYFSTISIDVAIISVSVSPSRVRAGDCVSISVVAKNEGKIIFGRSVDVAIYYNQSFLGTIRIPDVNPGGNETVSFSWSTKDLAEGKYTIEAVASQVFGETNTANNRYLYEYLMVTSPGQSFPFAIVAVVAAIIVVGIVGLLLKKRR